MKVLILNGSPRVGGNTTVAVEELEKVFRAEGVEVETVQVGACEIRGCIARLLCLRQCHAGCLPDPSFLQHPL